MTIITSLLLMVLGLSPSTGTSSTARNSDDKNKMKNNKKEEFHKKPYETGKL
jgi:hypothetical protein